MEYEWNVYSRFYERKTITTRSGLPGVLAFMEYFSSADVEV
jgi:hypothetical protein